MNPAVSVEAGSFRDPSGRVIYADDRVFRTVMGTAADSFRQAETSGIFRKLIADGMLVDFADITDQAPAWGLEEADMLLEHPRLPFVSYPYEWSFSLHKAAALAHLDLHLDLLRSGFTLSDATAYNIQFDGVRPKFIDHLSIRPYEDGEIWAGHRQFCMQFLNPLLMWSVLDVQPNHWFRGSLEGIAPEDLAKLLPWSKRFNWTILTHVIAQAAMQRRYSNSAASSAKFGKSRLPKQSFEAMLRGLRSTIAKLDVPSHKTVWNDYAQNTSYAAPETQAKHEFVQEMVAKVEPDLLYDLGCNSGDYSKAALNAGAKKVIGLDFDHGALEVAYRRAQSEGLDLLPVWLDAANPSPNQGWGQAERKGLAQRAKPDALLALAFIHHIAIGRNVPLDMAVDWLLSLAPTGVIEFPHKDDPMVQVLLSQRPDIFPEYRNDMFAKVLSARARIVKTVDVLPTRTLYWFERS
ncbi:class I SAM-dependent methyltransferase [Erythrobacter aureus]|uniref:Class I SAM-dependent methyltransferase n=1 Tax=Erythrobacter aureus TaxID=2182384 RepID=A0A345YE79_9SPHN|nr:class I SAM-dependent methyltransferase [Erythrobacter aureus]AXK42231.1 class I SAM-dependent methyltransferase [Erythrobacter aureus]